MLRTIYGDPERFKQQYWSQIPGMYFAGDGARIDKDGYFWLMGRVDDVLNVAGHRLSTMEIESALVATIGLATSADSISTGSAPWKLNPRWWPTRWSPKPLW